jgi:hypothetical protein
LRAIAVDLDFVQPSRTLQARDRARSGRTA